MGHEKGLNLLQLLAVEDHGLGQPRGLGGALRVALPGVDAGELLVGEGADRVQADGGFKRGLRARHVIDPHIGGSQVGLEGGHVGPELDRFLELGLRLRVGVGGRPSLEQRATQVVQRGVVWIPFQPFLHQLLCRHAVALLQVNLGGVPINVLLRVDLQGPAEVAGGFIGLLQSERRPSQLIIDVGVVRDHLLHFTEFRLRQCQVAPTGAGVGELQGVFQGRRRQDQVTAGVGGGQADRLLGRLAGLEVAMLLEERRCQPPPCRGGLRLARDDLPVVFFGAVVLVEQHPRVAEGHPVRRIARV